MGTHLSAACLLCRELAAAEAQGSEGWLQDSWTQSDVLVGGFMIEDGRAALAGVPPARCCALIRLRQWVESVDAYPSLCAQRYWYAALMIWQQPSRPQTERSTTRSLPMCMSHLPPEKRV